MQEHHSTYAYIHMCMRIYMYVHSEVVREKFSSALDSEYWHLNTLAKPQKVEYSHLKYHGQVCTVSFARVHKQIHMR